LILLFDTAPMKRRESQQMEAETGKGNYPWQSTQYANLVRYVPSGKYYARLRVAGKLIRRCLNTRSITVAKLKLAELEKQERAKVENRQRLVDGKVAVADLIEEYKKRLANNPNIKPRTRSYRLERIAAMLKSWPELAGMDARKVTPEMCAAWAGQFATKAAPSNYNNTIGTLRAILDIAVEWGIRYSNPASGLKRARVRPKSLALPSQQQFLALVDEIRSVPFGPGLASADLVEFLAYGGFRLSEARNITWADCDFDRGEILVRGDPVTGTKNSEVRRVPMIPDMRRLLQRLRQERPDAPMDAKVMRVKECQGALTRACKKLGIHRITHHDLRHLFATRCIESGVDIPTVSRWLGHKDGGALAMKVYGHLRDQHSQSMAARVTFDMAQSENVIPLLKGGRA